MGNIRKVAAHTRAIMDGKGEVYISNGVKVLIDVVIGALILYALYALFKNFIIPKSNGEVKSLFDQTETAKTDGNGAASGISG